MAQSTVTEKYQITIPKEVRDEMDLRPGEKVVVERCNSDSLVVRRYRRVRQPLKHLIGEKASHRKRITIEEFEEKVEAR